MRVLAIELIAVALLVPVPTWAESPTGAVGRSPALDDWEPYVGLLWRSRPTLLGLDARGRPVVEVARRVVVAEADRATPTPSNSGVVATRLRQVQVTCRKDDGSFDRPDTRRCKAELPGGLSLHSGERLSAHDAQGRMAVLALPHRRWARLIQVSATADGSRWALIWRSDTEDEVYGPTLFGVATGAISDLRARLAADPHRDWLARRKPRATPDLAEAQRLASADAHVAITLARVYARLGRVDDAAAALRPHVGPNAIAAYVQVAQHPELDRLRPRLVAPRGASPSAAWRRQFVLGTSGDGRYLALRRETRSGCAADHWYFLEITEATAPYRRVAALLVEHLDESGSGRPRLVVQRREAANDVLSVFGFVDLPLAKAASVAGTDAKRRFRYGPERLGVVSVESSSTARLLLDGRVATEVQLPGKRWGHGNGTVESVAIDLQHRRAFLLWREARPECCAGDARMPLDHDQISVVPLP